MAVVNEQSVRYLDKEKLREYSEYAPMEFGNHELAQLRV